jgi:hypothetical protein
MRVLSWQLFIWIAMIAACSGAGQAERKNNLPFFDLSGYIKNMISDSISQTVEKSITINGVIESKKIDQYAIWKDLRDFDTYDINRPALYDKYLVDTIQKGSIRQIVHTPKDDQLKVRLLKISFADGQVSEIQIKAATKSFLEDVSLEIVWRPNQGYVINRQSNRLFKADPSVQVVEVNLL